MRDMYMELQKLYSSVKLCVTVHTKSYVMFGHNSKYKLLLLLLLLYVNVPNWHKTMPYAD